MEHFCIPFLSFGKRGAVLFSQVQRWDFKESFKSHVKVRNLNLVLRNVEIKRLLETGTKGRELDSHGQKEDWTQLVPKETLPRRGR